ncbi:MAG: hypothetical protein ACLQI7_26590 [Streptosporangiaceae bacterium]|jgi:hypothetical protein
MGHWVWLNFAIGAVIFIAIAGIPLAFVLWHPHWRPGHDSALSLGDYHGGGIPAPVTVPAQNGAAEQQLAVAASYRGR